MKNLLVLIATLLSVQFNAIATANHGVHSEGVLYVEAQTVEAKKPCGNVTITIIADGEIIDKFVTRRKGQFAYVFEANTYYDILFSKEGYQTKHIEINTYTNKLKNEMQDFSFEVEMDQGEEDYKDQVAKFYFPRDKKRLAYNKM